MKVILSALILVASRLLQTMKSGRAFLALLVIVSYAVEESTPFSPEYICRYVVEGLNEAQINICIENPDAMVALYEVANKFEDECEYQFIDDRWNCTESNPPILGETSRELKRSTKEAAFVYALTSAATVYTITKSCSAGAIQGCGCDTSLNGQETSQGWQWGGCSDDVEYGALFAHDFLDARETEELDINKTETEIARALVHIHNNAVGRMAVQDGMEVECVCHGTSGSCTMKTCWRKLPTLRTISNMIKSKYDQAVKVSVQHTKDSPAILRSVGDESVTPTTDHLVFTKKSRNYCVDNSYYTVGRPCIPESVKSNIDAGVKLSVKVDKKLPICEELCCNGEYEVYSKTIVESCNCRFLWCCDIQCEECSTTHNTYTCTG